MRAETVGYFLTPCPTWGIGCRWTVASATSHTAARQQVKSRWVPESSSEFSWVPAISSEFLRVSVSSYHMSQTYVSISCTAVLHQLKADQSDSSDHGSLVLPHSNHYFSEPKDIRPQCAVDLTALWAAIAAVILTLRSQKTHASVLTFPVQGTTSYTKDMKLPYLHQVSHRTQIWQQLQMVSSNCSQRFYLLL